MLVLVGAFRHHPGKVMDCTIVPPSLKLMPLHILRGRIMRISNGSVAAADPDAMTLHLI